MSHDGAGTNVGGAYIIWSAKRVESKREANYSFVNKNLDILRLKYSNLRSQTNEQDSLVLFKTQIFQNI